MPAPLNLAKQKVDYCGCVRAGRKKRIDLCHDRCARSRAYGTSGKSGLGAILLDAEVLHFSYGRASKSTRQANVKPMVTSIHRLILRMVAAPVTILVAVRGHCLGGGLEVALAGHIRFTAPDATLGEPLMKSA